MVSKAILFLASLLCLTCVRVLDMGPHLFTRMEPPVPFYTPFTQPNNIWPLPCGTGFLPTWGDSQHQNPAAPFTAPFSNPWATPFPCNKTSKPGTEAKGVALTQAGPPRSGCSATGQPRIWKGEHPPHSPGNGHGLPGLDQGPGQKERGAGGTGGGEQSPSHPVFYGTTLSAQRQMAMPVVWRAACDRPTGRGLSESPRQVCYYRREVGGLECDLKGNNETLSINILTASSNMALKSEGNPILTKSLLSGHEWANRSDA